MFFMGSKRQYCKYIVPIIQKYIDENKIDIFIDCFVGGGNLADKIKNCEVIGCDLSPSLIALHQQAQVDFSEIPEDGSREMWDSCYAEWKLIRDEVKKDGEYQYNLKLKNLLYEIGAIEWYSSYCNGGFPRGYAKKSETRNYYKEAWRSHKKQAENENYKKIDFICGDYAEVVKYIRELHPEKKILVYADSPYQSTKPYAIAPKFDFNRYHNWLRETSKKIPIFVSEQTLPEDFNDYIIWQKDVKRTANRENNFKACEKLWLLKPYSPMTKAFKLAAKRMEEFKNEFCVQ